VAAEVRTLSHRSADAARVEESAAASGSLRQQAERLNAATAVFRPASP
jgi:methyl-accepting chemotaxis protein